MSTTETPQAVKETAAQIERILGNHDLVGCFLMADNSGHSGRLLVLDASWSAFESTGQGQVRIMDKPEEVILHDDYHERMARTVGVVVELIRELEDSRETLIAIAMSMAQQSVLENLPPELREMLRKAAEG